MPIVLFMSEHNSVRANFGENPFEFKISSFCRESARWEDVERRVLSEGTTDFLDFLSSNR